MYNENERVAAGCAVLDKHFGTPEWDTNINLPTLNISSSEKCVLGQLGGYSDLLYLLGQGEVDEDDGWFQWSQQHGFNNGYLDTERDRERLNEAWREEIARRRLSRMMPVIETPDYTLVPV